MWRVRTVFSGPQGTPWLSTAFFAETGGSAQQAVNTVGAFWGAVDALMVNQVNWTTENDVAHIDAVDGSLMGVTSTTPQSGSGSLVAEMLPTVSQALVRWRTAAVLHGRAVRGRTFVPGLTVSSADDGRVIGPTRTTIDAAAAAMISDANSVLVVWHRPHPDSGGAGQEPPVTSGSTWQSFASMRSRRD